MITSMRGCVAHIDRWSWPLNLMLFSCDVAYFMDDIHIWHEYNPWRDDVPRTIPRLIGQRSMSHIVFTFLESGRGYPSISRIYNFKFLLDLITPYYRVGSNLTAPLSLTLQAFLLQWWVSVRPSARLSTLINSVQIFFQCRYRPEIVQHRVHLPNCPKKARIRPRFRQFNIP